MLLLWSCEKVFRIFNKSVVQLYFYLIPPIQASILFSKHIWSFPNLRRLFLLFHQSEISFIQFFTGQLISFFQSSDPLPLCRDVLYICSIGSGLSYSILLSHLSCLLFYFYMQLLCFIFSHLSQPLEYKSYETRNLSSSVLYQYRKYSKQ